MAIDNELGVELCIALDRVFCFGVGDDLTAQLNFRFASVLALTTVIDIGMDRRTEIDIGIGVQIGCKHTLVSLSRTSTPIQSTGSDKMVALVVIFNDVRDYQRVLLLLLFWLL